MNNGEIIKIKGRGAAGKPAGRFDKTTSEPFDDGWNDEPQTDSPPPPETIVRWDLAKTIITKNDSPDIPHELSANPYRGCEHGCVYCFARPSHAFLGLSPGLDFETQIFAKQNAAELLRQELARPNYRPRALSLGINTDAYQPLERKLKITRKMLEVLAACRHPVSLVTKSALIERDLDILTALAKDNLIAVAVSITSLDANLTRKLEPRAASPARRLKIIRNLSAAGVPVSVLVAPVIPAVNDGEIESLLAAAADNGATGAGYVALRLPHELKTVFRQWLEAHLPQRAEKVLAQVRALHGGKDYEPQFFNRHRGRGVLAELIARRFAVARRRHGLDSPREFAVARRHGLDSTDETVLREDLFRPPPGAQRKLF